MSSPSTQKDAEITYDKAAKALHAGSYDAAYSLYIKAAQAFLHLSKQTGARVNDWKERARKCIEMAEKIQAYITRLQSIEDHSVADMTNGVADLSLTPVTIDYFSPYEQAFILERGSRVNGLLFAAWDASPPRYQSSPFDDPDGQPTLSEEQSKAAPVWRRSASSTPYHTTVVLEKTQLLPQDILQQVVTDCSIVIDDKLPYHPTSGALLCMSTTPYPLPPVGDSQEAMGPILWPSLLEKAYMKLMGGYDFPGSNSSIDVHALTGWIPEHIEIKSPGFESERTWTRIFEGFSTGQCLLTLGTGSTEFVYWRVFEMLGSHSYAVIGVNEHEESRWLVVLDSWTSSQGDEEMPKSKTLEIPWVDVLEVFDSIYVSWDPNIWKKSLSHHGMWKRRGEDDEANTRHLQLLFGPPSHPESGSDTDEIWILLTRHLYDTRRVTEFISLKVDIEDVLVSQVSPSIDLDRIAVKGTYTNSRHVLVRTRVPKSQSTGALSIFSSYDGPSSEIGYTSTIKGKFIRRNSGGNCSFPTFMVNPQYHLRVHKPRVGQNEKLHVAISLHASRDMPINVTTVWSHGERVVELTQNEIIMNSGAYSYGSARVTKDLLPGDYTIILSAFEPRYFGDFCLKVESSNRVDLTPIEQEGAGMYNKELTGSWNDHTAAGGPSFNQYFNNPIFTLTVTETTQVKIRLQLDRPAVGVPINVSVYPALTKGLLLHHTATSGAYSDSISGVVTPQTSLIPGKYWIIPSTYSAGISESFKLIVYSSSNNISISQPEGPNLGIR
ncbi:hypothetical protein ONZ45_g5319 [Pleurotus djamor]|nr:hypothetical protein ONZ45_g5319 [Pleurotus djamor]